MGIYVGNDGKGAGILGLPDGTPIWLRSVEPPDAVRLATYFKTLSVKSRRNRFLGAVSEVAPTVLDRMLHMRGMPGVMLIALSCDGPDSAIIAEAMQVGPQDGARREISLSVADTWQRRGLGTLMLRRIERSALLSGARFLFAGALRSNAPMKNLAHKQGFSIHRHRTDSTLIEIVKTLAIGPESPFVHASTNVHAPIPSP
jgi:GNAT superfamily N-acetyltransferase